MEEALDFLRAAGISGAAKYAAGTVCCCVDEAQKIPPALEREAEAVLLKVSEAWSKLVSLPPGAPHQLHSQEPPSICPASSSAHLMAGLERLHAAAWCRGAEYLAEAKF